MIHLNPRRAYHKPLSIGIGEPTEPKIRSVAQAKKGGLPDTVPVETTRMQRGRGAEVAYQTAVAAWNYVQYDRAVHPFSSSRKSTPSPPQLKA